MLPNKKSSATSSSAGDLTDREFDHIRKLIRDMTGISMSESKRQLVMRRVSNRLKALRMNSVQEYLAFLESGDPDEVEQFNNAVTTNLTSFFREKHHFEFLKQKALPEIVAKKERSSRRLRIWSAGCSTGEEPYSIAMTLKAFSADFKTWDARVLCTDLDTDVLRTASEGIYRPDRIESVPVEYQRKWLKKVGENFQASNELKSLLTFKQLNLMHQWPIRGKFDVIFCRNVVIYFDKPTQRVLMDRYANHIEDDGYLILGHSESLHNVSDRFKLIGKTIYQKVS